MESVSNLYKSYIVGKLVHPEIKMYWHFCWTSALSGLCILSDVSAVFSNIRACGAGRAHSVSVAFIAHSEWILGLAARATSKEWASPRILCPGQARLQVMGRYGDELFCNLVKFMKYSIQNRYIFTILLEKIMLHFLSPKDFVQIGTPNRAAGSVGVLLMPLLCLKDSLQTTSW